MAPSTWPVCEVAVSTDSHALVIRGRALPAGGGGEVVLDVLPQPEAGWHRFRR